MKACVAIAARGQPNIKRALGSVLAQRYINWMCVVVGKADIGPFTEDTRIVYLPVEGTTAEKIAVGMRYAQEHADFWVPLRPEDWFQSWKLALDRAALDLRDAVYGPFMNMKDKEIRPGDPIELGHGPSFNPTRYILRGTPLVSWGNVAVKTGILAQLPPIPPRIREHPFYFVNMAIARVTEWAWRGEVGKVLYVAPTAEEFLPIWKDRMSVDVTVVDSPASEPEHQADYLEACRAFA